METTNLEKSFAIDIIASMMENKVLVITDKTKSFDENKRKLKKFEDDLFEFCSFITGEYVDFSNLDRLSSIIKTLILKQYPNMRNIHYNVQDCINLNSSDIKIILDAYKIKYGENIVIKSLKNEVIKTLEYKIK